jgi:hypothetical protein
MDDTWVLNVELKLQDYATKAAKDIKAVIDPMQGQFQDLQKAVDSFSKSISNVKLETLEDLNFDEVTKSISEYNKQLNEAITKLGNATDIAEADKANSIIKEKINELSEIRNKIEEEYFTQVLDWQKKYNQDLSAQKLTMEEIGKLNTQEQNQYKEIIKLEKARSAFNKAEGAAQMNVAAEARVAQSKIGPELSKVQAGAQVLSRQFTMTDLAASKFISNLFGPYGKVLGFLANQLDVIAGRAEKFSNAMYQGAGGMNQIAQQAALMAGRVKASSDEVDRMIMSMRTAGAQEKDMMQLAETGVILAKATGADAAITSKFAVVMTVLTGNVKKAEASMMLMYRASVQFGLAAEDVNTIMRKVADSAIYLGSFGADSVERFTENMIAASAAAKKLGQSSDLLVELNEKAKGATAFAALLGGDVLSMKPEEKMEGLIQKASELREEFDSLTDVTEKNIFAIRYEGQLGVDRTQVINAIDQLIEMGKQKEVMVKAKLNVTETERQLNEVKQAAIEATTGVFGEMEAMFSKFSNMVQGALAVLLPIIKPIFQIINVILDNLIGLLGPVVYLVMNMMKWLDVTTEIAEFGAVLKEIFAEVGKVLAYVVGAFLFPLIAGIKVIITVTKAAWVVIGPVLKIFISLLAGVAEGFRYVAEGIMWVANKVIDLGKAIADYLVPDFLEDWFNEWNKGVDIMNSIATAVKWVGVAVGAATAAFGTFWLVAGGGFGSIIGLYGKLIGSIFDYIAAKIKAIAAAKALNAVENAGDLKMSGRLMKLSDWFKTKGPGVTDWFGKLGGRFGSIGKLAGNVLSRVAALGGGGAAGLLGTVVGVAGAAAAGAAIGTIINKVFKLEDSTERLVKGQGTWTDHLKAAIIPGMQLGLIYGKIAKASNDAADAAQRQVQQQHILKNLSKEQQTELKEEHALRDEFRKAAKRGDQAEMERLNKLINEKQKAVQTDLGKKLEAEAGKKAPAEIKTSLDPVKSGSALMEARALLHGDFKRQEEGFKTQIEQSRKAGKPQEHLDMLQKQVDKFGSLTKRAETTAEPIPTVKITESEGKKVKDSEKEKQQKETNKKLEKLVNVVDAVTKDSAIYQLLQTYLPEIASSKTVSARANSWM